MQRKIISSFLMLCFLLSSLPVWAGQTINPTLDCEGSNAAYAAQGIPCRCVNGQIVCDQPSGGGAVTHGNAAGNVKAMFVGALFEGLLTSLFTPPTAHTANSQEALAAQQKAAALAAQQAAYQRAQEAAFQAQHDKMMQSFKQLDGSQGVAFKGLSDSALAYKTLDSDAETMAANARKPFDTAGNAALSPAKIPGQATPFFGDTMPLKDVQFLVNPDNDPRVVDLREAHSFMVKNLKNDKEMKGNGKPIVKAPDCAKLRKKMNGFITQQEKFYKTVTMAQEQLNSWETQNRNALINAAKDGIEYFTGQLLDCLAKRGEAAERLQRIFEKNAAKMAQDGLDVAAIEAKIQRLKMLSSAGKVAELSSNIKDWQTFVKDGMSSLVTQLTDSNRDIQGLFDDPRMQKYFETESPKLQTLLDISNIAAANKVFGKWVAKKVPLIAGVELSINESYNALDWLLSFKRMTEANRINGKVLAAAKALQHHIDDTSLVLQDCRP